MVRSRGETSFRVLSWEHNHINQFSWNNFYYDEKPSINHDGRGDRQHQLFYKPLPSTAQPKICANADCGWCLKSSHCDEDWRCPERTGASTSNSTHHPNHDVNHHYPKPSQWHKLHLFKSHHRDAVWRWRSSNPLNKHQKMFGAIVDPCTGTPYSSSEWCKIKKNPVYTFCSGAWQNGFYFASQCMFDYINDAGNEITKTQLRIEEVGRIATWSTDSADSRDSIGQRC